MAAGDPRGNGVGAVFIEPRFVKIAARLVGEEAEVSVGRSLDDATRAPSALPARGQGGIVSGMAAAPPLTLGALNQMDRHAFAEALGAIFERSAWVAERAWDARPFRTLADLHGAMVVAVRTASESERLALLRAHPELAGHAARAGPLAAFSALEQAGAGLRTLDAEERQAFDRLNAAYGARFGFPFIICVRNRVRERVLDAFAQRLGNPVEREIETALAEVFEIARHRLESIVVAPRCAEGDPPMGQLTTHVLDTARGCPAGGVRIDVLRRDAEGRASLVRRVVTGEDGRTASPLLAAQEMAVGSWELVFHVGAYFAATGVPRGDPPFLDEVPVRFAIADAGAHYHVPLLASPWSYAVYRGS